MVGVGVYNRLSEVLSGMGCVDGLLKGLPS